MKKVFKCVAVTVSGTIGIGFLSGMEYSKFVGNNIVLYMLVFTLSNFVFAQWASSYRTQNIDKLCCATFNGFAVAVTFLVALTNLFAVVSILSATQSLFSCLLPSKLPLFPLVVCVVAAFMSAKERTKNLLSYITVALAICSLILVPTFGSKVEVKAECNPLLTICYALFCSTMLVGVTAKIAFDNDTKTNVAYCALSAVLFGVAMSLMRNFGKLSTIEQGLPKVLQIVVNLTYLLSSTTSVYANVVTPLSLLQDVTKDNFWANYLLFGFCLPLCEIGVDYVMKFSYIGVSIVGVVLTTAILVNLFSKRGKKNKKYSTMPNIVLYVLPIFKVVEQKVGNFRQFEKPFQKRKSNRQTPN